MSPTTTPAQLPPTLPSLATAYRALVVGATGAIGAALVAQLQADPRCAAVCALSRRSNPAIDFAAPDSIAAAAQALRAQGPWHLIVVATGMLTGPTSGPEKRLAELNATHMAASFATNTIGPALVLAHFAPQLAKGGAQPAGGAVGQGGQHRRQPPGRLVQLPRLQGGAEHAAQNRRH